MKLSALVLVAGLSIAGVPASAPGQASAPPAFSAQTTLVIVPALVRDSAGEPVFALTANDFVLTDDGVPQKLTLEEESGAQPLALAVVVETGGAGAREFDKLGPLTPMLESIVGNVPHQVAVIAFDSQPNLVQDFTWDLDRATRAVAGLMASCTRQRAVDPCEERSSTHQLSDGDNGAAILDSLSYAVGLLDLLPQGYRRAILLVSETVDRGSHITVDEAVRAISNTNTIVYSVEFSTAKSEAAHYASRELPLTNNPYPNPPHGCMGKSTDPDPDLTANGWAKLYDCAGELVPPLALAKLAAIAAHNSLLVNAPQTVARLTGGESFRLTDARSLERALAAISNHIPNRYMLTYHPQAPHPGFHAIRLTLPDHPSLQVTARTSYWASTPSPAP
ncbi:MAG: VWA domain-containing protein [Terracidiphilus sp.]